MPPSPPPARPPAVRDREDELVYGLRAALAVFAHRPDAIVRIHHTAERRTELREALRSAAKRRVPYREVDDEELARIAGSRHHEGVCFVTRPRLGPTVPEFLETLVAAQPALIVATDHVGNPHNFGAVLRSAAYLGANAVLAPRVAGQAWISAAVTRTAEGAAESLPILGPPSLTLALRVLRERGGFSLVGSDANAKPSVFDQAWAARTVLVIGNEQTGLSAEVRGLCGAVVSIPGSGKVESLNASAAAAVLIALAARGVTARRG